MTKEMERMKEIEARKEELRAEIAKGEADEARLSAIKEEAEKLNKEEGEIRAMSEINTNLEPQAQPKVAEKRTSAEIFAETNQMRIAMFDKEGRALLTTTGTLVKPTGTATEIGGLPELTGTILDDVSVVDATGTQAWEFPYKKTGSKAKNATEGQVAGSTASGTFDKVVIGPEEWTTYDEISKQVAKMTPVAYEAAVKENAVIALREEAEKKLTDKVVASEIIEKKENVKLDEKYLRNLKLGYKNPKGLTGKGILYIRQEDLIKLGEVRGTSEKKPLYSFTYDAENENTGVITEGGISVRFSLNENLPAGQQLYGNPKAIKMLMWGPYEVTTDGAGENFKKRMIGILGDQTAGAGLVVYHGMQLINQTTFAP